MLNLYCKICQMKFFLLILIFSSLFFPVRLGAQTTDTTSLAKIVSASDISGQWFLVYHYQLDNKANAFQLKRGFFTIKTKLNSYLSTRYTQDITMDSEGDDAGNIEIRIRYLYLKLVPHKFEVLKNTFFEFGLVHRPWLDFEQSINNYRVQGKMFAEDFEIINSADLGLTYMGELGKKMNNAYTRTVNPKSIGRYGSFAIGVYNGGGYHAFEQNRNKTFETRLTVRPLPDFAPGLQFTYTNAFGSGNTTAPKVPFAMHLWYLSAEHTYFVGAVQYLRATGNFSGNKVDIQGLPLKSMGYALLGELKSPQTNMALFARFSNLSFSDNHSAMSELSSGITYRFAKNKIVAYYTVRDDNYIKNKYLELALEIAF